MFFLVFCLAFLCFLPLVALSQYSAKPVMAKVLNLLPAVGGDDGVCKGHPDHHVDEEGDSEQRKDREGGGVQSHRCFGRTAQESD